MTKKRVNNGQALRLIKSINEDYKNANDGESMLTPKCEEFIDEILNEGGDNDLLVNALFNKKLKAMPKEFFTKIK